MTIRERLAIFYSRLRSAPAAKSADEAFQLICRTLEEVEKEFSLVMASSPPPRSFDGRMHLPQADNIEKCEDNSMWVKTRRHRISIKTDGGFVIFREMPEGALLIEFEKVGVRR